tara:strand:- start:586 stop:885 length:300 start_codon:yes stop_codon:yes gene_type:complete
MKKVVLDLDSYLSWRSVDRDLEIKVTSGDNVVLTISPNGYDAVSTHLENGGVGALVKAGEWFTLETVGIRSEICFNNNDFKETVAAAEWMPVPRASNNS